MRTSQVIVRLSVTVLVVLSGAACAPVTSSMSTRDFTFVSSGRALSGLLDLPTGKATVALVIFLHGSGGTNVRTENRYIDLRRRFADLGIASVVWDKPGQGRSEGTFDDDQSIESSAQEVLDAIAALRADNVPGSHRIGIWSTSRGSWVAPVAISGHADVDFWISVSGGPAEDNKHYLMEANLPLEGRSGEETAVLLNEWRQGRRTFLEGGSYDAYLSATRRLREDPAVRYLAGDLTGTRDIYEAEQRAYLQSPDTYAIDARTMAVLRVRNFEQILAALNLDVLALFGEKDTNVDWRRARELYQATVGRNPLATLTVRTFPDCNHSLNVSATGSVREVEGMPLDAGPKCPGYYDVQIEWLRRRIVPNVMQ
jgi:pimeloyl-ACP methyl ester carboxylesterase